MYVQQLNTLSAFFFKLSLYSPVKTKKFSPASEIF